jgi:predicted nucleic acid-binding Zn ribbon protein
VKRQNDQPLKDVIQQLLDSYHLREKVNEIRLVENWEKLFGKTISKYTKKMFVNNKKLYLIIDSAPLRQELMYSRDKMVERINEAIEKDFVREVVIR